MDTLDITAAEYAILASTIFENGTLFTNEHEGSSLGLDYGGGQAYLCEADGSYWLAFDGESAPVFN